VDFFLETFYNFKIFKLFTEEASTIHDWNLWSTPKTS